jgi:hypothetical protein
LTFLVSTSEVKLKQYCDPAVGELFGSSRPAPGSVEILVRYASALRAMWLSWNVSTPHGSLAVLGAKAGEEVDREDPLAFDMSETLLKCFDVTKQLCYLGGRRCPLDATHVERGLVP